MNKQDHCANAKINIEQAMAELEDRAKKVEAL